MAQSVAIPPYTRFVKAIDQFLCDETEAAIDALQRDSQINLPGDLHRFSLYWLGYILTTIGDYEAAERWLTHDKLGLPSGDAERYELDCLILETRFFSIAKLDVEDVSEERGVDKRPPRDRLEEVVGVLDELGQMTETVRAAVIEDPRHLRSHLLNSIARIRADVLAWVAYDPGRVDAPLHTKPGAEQAVTTAREVLDRFPVRPYSRPLDDLGPDVASLPLAEFKTAQEKWDLLKDDEVCRAWSLCNALAICKADPRPDFEVLFALAECEFMLGDEGAERAFQTAEAAHALESNQYRETRQTASLEQSSLIYHSRLLYLHEGEEHQRRAQERAVWGAFDRTQQALDRIPEGPTTIFSQLQRRNLRRVEFQRENEAILRQEGLSEGDAEPRIAG